MENTAQLIKDKAIELGFEKCGIIKMSEVADYEEKLDERIARIPMGEMQYGRFRGLANPSATVLWARSIIVAVFPERKYNVPEGFEGMYGKAYMFDGRLDEQAPEFVGRSHLEAFVESLGIKIAGEAKFGITAVRWAAYKAGLGLIRQNNFFYTENGSYNFLTAWVIDREFELKEQANLKKCPESCGKCIEACPTKTLCSPYTMSSAGCVSFQTSMSAAMGMGVPGEELAGQIGGWLYGCDVCQDVCPFNKGKWTGGEDFPGLSEFSQYMSPEKIMAMDYDEIARTLGVKYWYISAENLWKWKLNALTVMQNNFSDKYSESIKLGLTDTSEIVRDFAGRVCEKLHIDVNAL